MKKIIGLLAILFTFQNSQAQDFEKVKNNVLIFKFENAKAGIASIETSFATIQHLFPTLSDNRISELFSLNARSIFKLDNAGITEGAVADLTFYNKKETTLLSQKDSKSKSANSPFWDVKLTGKIKGLFSKGQLYLA